MYELTKNIVAVGMGSLVTVGMGSLVTVGMGSLVTAGMGSLVAVGIWRHHTCQHLKFGKRDTGQSEQCEQIVQGAAKAQGGVQGQSPQKLLELGIFRVHLRPLFHTSDVIFHMCTAWQSRSQETFF